MELPLIHAKGTPHEIGLQHGRQAKAAIKANMLIGHRDGEAIDVECAPDDLYFLYP